MTFFRRILLILLGLLLVALVTIILLLPDTLVNIGQNLAQISPIVRTALVIVANVLILAVLYLQVRPLPTPNRSGLSVRTSGALADISPESAQQRILKVIRSVPSVVSAEANLTALEGKADIDMNIGVVGDNINVPKKQEEIDRALRQVMLKQLGLQLASRPRIHIRLMTEDELAPPPRPIAPRPVAETPPPPIIREEPRPAAPRVEERPAIREEPIVTPAPRFEERPPIREAPSAPVISPDAASSPDIAETVSEPDFIQESSPERPLITEPPVVSAPAASSSSEVETSGLYDEDEARSDSDENEDWSPPPPANS